MMKIIIVTRNLLSGGAERVLSQLINKWSYEGIEVKVILIDKREIFYSIPENVEIFQIGHRSSNKLFDKVKRYLEVRRLIKKYKPNVVLSMPEEIGIYVLMFLMGVNVPVVVSERNDPWKMPNKKVTRILRKIIYPFSSGVIFQTRQASLFFSNSIRKKGVILPNPFDSKRVDKIFHTLEKTNKIVSAGRLEAQKNFSLLIEAFQIVHSQHPEYKLEIYGEGSQRNLLMNLIMERGLTSSISLPGKTHELFQKIANADLFVLSSDYEGVPNVLIEALAIGTPCVSTDSTPGGAATLIKNGENGFLVPIRDKEELAKKILEVIDNPDISQKFSDNSIKIKEKLDIDKVANAWLNYLKNKSKK